MFCGHNHAPEGIFEDEYFALDVNPNAAEINSDDGLFRCYIYIA